MKTHHRLWHVIVMGAAMVAVCAGGARTACAQVPPGYTLAPIVYLDSSDTAHTSLASAVAASEAIVIQEHSQGTNTFGSVGVCPNNQHFFDDIPNQWCVQWTNVTPGVGTSSATLLIQAQAACEVNGSYVYYGDTGPGTFGPNMPWLCLQSGPLTPTLVDPVAAQDVTDGSITTNPNTLALISNTVFGAAADGTAEIVVKIAAPTAGTALTLTLLDENGNPAVAGSQNALGSLKTILTTDTPSSTVDGTPITVTTVAVTGGGSMAFAVYTPPKDFVRDNNSSDPLLPNRTVSVQITANDETQQQIVAILRPPVAFVHGLWGGPMDGSGIMVALSNDQVGLMPYELDFAGQITLLTTNPGYGPGSLSVSGDNLGFQYGATKILALLNDAIADYRNNNAFKGSIAVSQADVVGHSMGGNIARTLPLISGFAANVNYDAGPVHKLITIGTPHLGSPLAGLLLQSANNCVVQVLAAGGHYTFLTAETVSDVSYNGGVGDLQGALNGTSLSQALVQIQPSTAQTNIRIPTALIAGEMQTAQLNSLNTSRNAKAIRTVCGTNPLASDPLAKDLTPSGWQSILGADSDAIVPVNSELAGPNGKSAFPLFGEVHSPGAVSLGFGEPTELDDPVIPPEVLQLLNTPVDQPTFMALP